MVVVIVGDGIVRGGGDGEDGHDGEIGGGDGDEVLVVVGWCEVEQREEREEIMVIDVEKIMLEVEIVGGRKRW